MKINKICVVIIGGLPPPYMGPTIANEIILNSRLKKSFELVHLDSSDHRDLSTLNKLDTWNFILALKSYFQLLRIVLKYVPEVVYMSICQTTLGYLKDVPFIFLSKLFRCRVLCHLRGGNFRNWYLSASPLTRRIVRRVHSLVDGQIVLGESFRNLFKGILPDEKIFVVPNGGNFFLDLKKKDISNGKIKILFLSNLNKEKGVFDILDAIPEVVQFNRNLEFIFSGTWSNEKTKREFIKYKKKSPFLPIILTGPVYGKAKTKLLLSADIFILPTYYPAEGHPWAIVEAMAAGLPIITTDQGAITESVKDGVNGFIVEKRNPHQIAEKIKFLIENPDVRKNMGEESRRLYLENFTEEKMIERLSYAFYSVLSR